MRSIFEDNGTGQLTGRELKEIAQALPDDAKIIQLRVEESQRDGWYWMIRAQAEVKPRPGGFSKRSQG